METGGFQGSLVCAHTPSVSSRFRERSCFKNKVKSARGRHDIDVFCTCTHTKLSEKGYGEEEEEEKKEETEVQRSKYTQL